MYQFIETRAASSIKSAIIQDPVVQLLASNRSKVARDIRDFSFNKKRSRVLSSSTEIGENKNGIVYWMSRNQRVEDNWSLLYAQALGFRNSVPLHVVFCLADKFLDATYRHFKFMLDGLKEVQTSCEDLNINFHLLRGQAGDQIPKFVKSHRMGAVVSDCSPLRIHRGWVDNVRKNLPADVPFVQVDAYNIVPVWEASDKEEPAAFALRNKIMPKLNEFLTEFPPVARHPFRGSIQAQPIDWDQALKSVKTDESVGEVPGFRPGYIAAAGTLDSFIKERLRNYAKLRNDPVQQQKAVSNLSPYFHFGQIAPQRAVLEVQKQKDKFKEDVDSFINEAVIWRELAENLCFYNSNYDNFDGAKDWARNSLRQHLTDKREHIYSLEEFEDGKTSDNLWNAAQLEMKIEGKMSGYMRMYWAKKILEWTKTPEEAIKIAVYLNDRYSLDGRDPNGYLGIMWSIAGVNDRSFQDRDVVGKVRFMSYKACFQKFDAKAYMAKYCGGVYKKN